MEAAYLTGTPEDEQMDWLVDAAWRRRPFSALLVNASRHFVDHLLGEVRSDPQLGKELELASRGVPGKGFLQRNDVAISVTDPSRTSFLGEEQDIRITNLRPDAVGIMPAQPV